MLLISALEESFSISIEGIEIIPENFGDLESINELVSYHLNNKLNVPKY
jgi:acyl carrier protein